MIYNASGSGEKTILSLPAGAQWRRLGSGIAPKGYRYTGMTGEAVLRHVVKNDLLKVKARGASFGYTLNEPSQGSLAVRITAGSEVAWCGLSMAEPGFDVQDSFGREGFPSPAAYPPVP